MQPFVEYASINEDLLAIMPLRLTTSRVAEVAFVGLAARQCLRDELEVIDQRSKVSHCCMPPVALY
jgi:hypothetical protein